MEMLVSLSCLRGAGFNPPPSNARRFHLWRRPLPVCLLRSATWCPTGCGSHGAHVHHAVLQARVLHSHGRSRRSWQDHHFVQAEAGRHRDNHSHNWFQWEIVEHKNIRFTVWDLGGQDQSWSLWRRYFQDARAIIFVVDTNDRDRVVEGRDELHRMLNEDDLRSIPLLVFANKKDLPNAMNVAEMTDKLGLHSLQQCCWFIQKTCATSGEGLYKGLDWLSSNIATKRQTCGERCLAVL